MVLDESVSEDSTTVVFPMDSTDPSTFNPSGPAFPIVDDHTLHGQFYGVYLQDEWKIIPVDANFERASMFSIRHSMTRISSARASTLS